MLPVLEQNIVLYLPWKTQQRILHFKKPKFYAKGKCFQRTNLKNRPSDLIRTDTQWVTLSLTSAHSISANSPATVVAVTKGGIAHETEILCGSEPARMAAYHWGAESAP